MPPVLKSIFIFQTLTPNVEGFIIEMMLIQTFLQEYGLMWMLDGNLKVNQPKLKLIFCTYPLKKSDSFYSFLSTLLYGLTIEPFLMHLFSMCSLLRLALVSKIDL